MFIICICAASGSEILQEKSEKSTPVPTASQSSIIIMDNGAQVTIDIDDISTYHAKMEAEEEGTPIPEKAEVDPCCAWMFRSLLAGIQALWGETIPARSDISITSNLVSCGALHTGWYVSGSGQGIETASPGRLILLKPDGTELKDYSHDSRSKIAKNRTPENYQIVLTSISTGESVGVSLREDVFPDGFFELFKKIKTDSSVTKEETAQFKKLKDEFKDNLVLKPDSELFSIVKN